ncbi:polyketide beta-ketoacyl synthase [Streptomyces sp. NRRL B-1140]|uniref:lasso peptide biosynthesis B2 protein n=1 Tax=Streptomyces sp. NRRL B-1140 TaxID=1415549 RepID=UPI0006AE8C92|nr:lasso peptide biosynthesis B2 protein [Streptomyces sp. NRRL B-1140]KOX02570.1 polyketide beta-ketoacyl synthase [Streptomyces sp. NRRL B-1140]
MTSPEVIFHDPRSVPLRRRIPVRLAVGAARLLARRRPRRIRAALEWLRRGARPATLEQTRAARDSVVTVSLACGGREGCLPRSLATVMLCRLHGQWPTWCVGARRLPPFGAHAWVEAEGVPVGEDHPPDYFRPLFTVPCAPGSVSREAVIHEARRDG